MTSSSVPDLYRMLYEHGMEAVFLTEPSGRFLAANPAACAMLGRSEAEICSLGWEGLVDPSSPQLEGWLAERERTGSARAELTFIGGDGRRFEAEVSSKKFTDADGRIRTALIARDISKQHQALQMLAESERKFRTVATTMAEGVVFQGSDGGVVWANPAAERILRDGADDALGRTSDDPAWGAVKADGSPFPGDEHPAMVTLSTGVPQSDVVMGIHAPNGERRWISINSAPVFDGPTSHPSAVVTTFHDITLQRHIENELRVASVAIDALQEAVMFVDPDLTIIRVNRAFTEVTGYSEEEAVGKSTRLLRSGRQGLGFYEDMWKAIETEGRWQGELWNRRKNGEVYPEWLSISTVTDDRDAVRLYVAIFLDLSVAKRAEEDIHSLSYFDVLTGLPNRQLLGDRLRQAVLASARTAGNGLLLVLDLDNFTIFNDTRGHGSGDELLRAVATRLGVMVHSEDTFARLSSDEFALVAWGLDSDRVAAAVQAENIAERLLETLRTPFEIAGELLSCSASVGIALFGNGAPEAEELMKRAEIAMVSSKQSGGRSIRFYDAVIQATLEERARMEVALRQAIPEQLSLLYQPQVDRRGRFLGAEALVRWQHPGRGLVGPAEFIPLAEETGLIVSIGEWVLEAASRQVASWAENPRTKDLIVGVNISAQELRDPRFAERVLDVVRRNGVDPTRLRLELTESVLVSEPGAVALTMSGLRSEGIQFALDDFGTGYSSLAYLKDLPLSQLKIDQSFVRGLNTVGRSTAIVRTIVGLGQSLGLEVIAEGVETEAERDQLTALGCGEFQGYLFGRPMPAVDLEALIVEGER